MKIIKSHLEASTTLLLTLIGVVILNLTDYVELEIKDNLMFALLGIFAALMLDFSSKLKELQQSIKDIDYKVNEIEVIVNAFPEADISIYEELDQIVSDFDNRIDKGKHNVDMLLLDTKIRTRSSDKVNKMREFVAKCTSEYRIKTRVIFSPEKDSIYDRLVNIANSVDSDNNSFYAYIKSDISFASVLIIDNEIVSIRAPYNAGSKKAYCIVKNRNLCKVYSAWFELLWQEATVIDKENYSAFYSMNISLVSDNEKKEEIRRTLEGKSLV